MGDFSVQINGTTDNPIDLITQINKFLPYLKENAEVTRADFSDTTTGSVSLMGDELHPSGEVDDQGNPVVEPETETPSNEPETEDAESNEEDGA